MTRRLYRPAAWVLVSAVVAPVAVVGCWTVAAQVQPSGYDAVHDTISALARHGAAHRQIMTVGLTALGLAHVVTAAGLRTLSPAARTVLALAGFATLGVAVFAQPEHGSSRPHVVLATIGFVLLVAWPAVATRGVGDRPVVLSAPVGVGVSAVSAALLVWFALAMSGGPLGVAERVLVAEQALWPLCVVVALRRVGGSMNAGCDTA
ncbi:DUF998 domain-containing protein [uncultured Jatrophihabitans sp.]|uniref:DUF998 domain-containing protein n=1 Tax=uncultured Jatrophihabitans sp. TaxID=1610747 RepID=UPI0035CA4625